MGNVSLIRRGKDCPTCGLPWVELWINEALVVDCCIGLFQKGQIIQFNGTETSTEIALTAGTNLPITVLPG